MKFKFLFLSILFFNFSLLFAQVKTEVMKKLPKAILQEDCFALISLPKDEAASTKNSLKNYITTELVSAGFNLKYVYIMGTNMKELESLQKKLAIKNSISVTFHPLLGITMVLSVFKTDKLVSYKSYTSRTGLKGLWEDLNEDLNEQKVTNDNFTAKADQIETNIKSFKEIIRTNNFPEGIKTNKIAVLVTDSAMLFSPQSDAASQKFHTSQLLKIQKYVDNIKEIMKEYPYEYEIVPKTSFNEDPKNFKFALDMDYLQTFGTKNTKSGTNSDGTPTIKEAISQDSYYYIYIYETSKPEIYHISDKWISKISVEKVYKKFVDNINSK